MHVAVGLLGYFVLCFTKLDNLMLNRNIIRTLLLKGCETGLLKVILRQCFVMSQFTHCLVPKRLCKGKKSVVDGLIL